MKIVHRPNVADSYLSQFIPDPIMRQILAVRGVKGVSDLDISIKGLLPPTNMCDCAKAADIIAHAVMRQEHIMISGDYDIDGMSGTALGVRCLSAFGLPEEKISYYVPSRYDDGYGLNEQVVEHAILNGVKLIVTVDNGISANAAVAYAKDKGLTVVVTDHHEPGAELPPADAVVDPKRKDDEFPSKHLSGVGVLFYVMAATRSRLVELGYYADKSKSPNMTQFTDLVALGTIGDVMTLDSNNRRLVKEGLRHIHKGKACRGLLALLGYLKIDPAKVKIRTIAFDLCPRFNAATRIKIAQNPAILNLLSEDDNLALLYAKQLDMYNKRRMDHEKVMLAKALSLYAEERALIDLVNGKISAPVPDENAVLGQELPEPKDEAPSELPPLSADLMQLKFHAHALAPQDSSQAAMIQHLLGKGSEGESELDAIEAAYNDFDGSEEESNDLTAGIVLYEPTFLRGLVGLVATRMRERYHRPCMIFGADLGAGIDGGVDLMSVIDNKEQVIPSTDTSGVNFPPRGKVMSAASGIMPNVERALNHPTEESKDQSQEQSTKEADDLIVGSARSVPGIDLMEVFAYIKQREPNILVAGGGHAMAAGATIHARDVARFKNLFNDACAACRQEVVDEDAYTCDATLPHDYLCLPFAHDIELFGPWGKDFEEPCFDGIFTVVAVNILKNRHLKVKLRTDTNQLVEAIKFRASLQEKSIVPDTRVQIVYTLGIDRYFNNPRLQLQIEAIEPLDASAPGAPSTSSAPGTVPDLNAAASF